MKHLITTCVLLAAATTSTAANKFDYQLKPQQIAPDTYLFEGKKEDFTRENGGNVVNTGFIITEDGIIVIDSGPSKRFGEQQKAAIAAVSSKPVTRVYNTHHHPDHFLGNQAYADVPLYALPGTKASMAQEGDMFSSNMYRMVGDWMRGTQALIPPKDAVPGRETVGGHELEWISLDGHTHDDLVLLDHTTGVLFAGDLVFHNRAATTPHADIAHWLTALDELEKIPFRLMVPGHGEVVKDKSAIHQTRDYLTWLRDTLESGAANGLDMNEVMQTPVPERFRDIALTASELQRSVAHLYPGIEERYLQPASRP